MKFDIDQIKQLQQAMDGMGLRDAFLWLRENAPDIYETPIGEAIVTGLYDPVAWAQEYNAIAGDKAMEYASGKVEL
jgi:hypothetical protein